MANDKQSRGDGNIKRINDAKAIRLRRGRKRETLQGFKREVLQPWIDFANLSPFEPLGDDWRVVGPDDTTLCNKFVQDFGDRPEPSPLFHLAQRVTRFRTREPRLTHELVTLFGTVSTVFGRLQSMTWPSADMEKNEPLTTEHYASVSFPMDYSIEDKGDGRVSFEPDPILERFKKALEGTEILRVRRCPICGRFYYAVRANKGACDEHLARVRVQRGRDPYLRKQYEANRRINELVRQDKLSILQAKAILQTKSTRRRRKT